MVSSRASSNHDNNNDDDGGGVDDDNEDRVLHFERLLYDDHTLVNEGGSSIAVHDKFILVGTQVGHIHILDHQGNCTRTFTNHTTAVTHISIDDKGEYMASCSANGVSVHGTDSQENNLIFPFVEPVHFCVLDPNFMNDGKRRFVVGTDKILFYQKNIFKQYKMSVIYRGEGAIRSCSWRGRFAAFSTDISVIVFDMSTYAIVCKFKRDQVPSRPAELYPCQLAWMDDRQLLVGWADRINLCHIKHKDEEMRRTQASASNYYLEISSMFTTEDIYVCGLAPCDANIAILGTEKLDGGRENTAQMLFQLLEPHNKYCTQISSDKIPLRMTSKLRTDFMLTCLSREQRFFILSPQDIIVVRWADKDDYVDRLLADEMYEEAMHVMMSCSAEIRRHSLLVVGRHYLSYLLDTKQFEEVGPLCEKIYGGQVALWEEQVYSMAPLQLCHVIADFLPYRPDKKLSPSAYEIVLNEFIQMQPEQVPNLVRRWRGFFAPGTLQLAVEERLKFTPNMYLQEAVGLLLVYQSRFAEALDIFLEIGSGKELHNLLDLQFNKLKDIILERVLDFMKIDYKEAAHFLAKNNYYDVKKVSEQLRDHRDYLLEYLRCKFTRNPQALDEGDHDLLVDYFAVHDKQGLLPFLKKSNKFPLEKALRICEAQGLVQEAAFLYERMGSHKKALEIILDRLADVEQAIEFCKEQERDDMWDFLIEYCVKRPQLLTILLNRVGNYIDPSMVIQAIPTGLEIPQLRDSLVRIIQDFKLQIALRESCNKIIQSNRNSLFAKLCHLRARAIVVTADSVCEVCNRPIVPRGVSSRKLSAIAFSCNHSYHADCLEDQDVPSCRICYKNRNCNHVFDYYTT